MDEDIFAATDAAIAKAKGSKDPEVIADFHRSKILIGSPLEGAIIGMSFRCSTLGVISVNRNLDTVWRLFAYWHELAHVFRKHIDEPEFGFHQDRGLFTVAVDSHTISRQEREANIISAEYNLDTGDVLELIGYNNRTMQDYRRLKQYQEQLASAYDALRFSTFGEHPTNAVKYRMAEYRRTLHELEEKRTDLESDLAAMHCIKSFSEIAGELGTNEIILKYKLEAMRIRGYDIDVQELEQYNKVFSGVI